MRLVGAVLAEIDDEWAVVRRYMTMDKREEDAAEQKSLKPAKHAA